MKVPDDTEVKVYWYTTQMTETPPIYRTYAREYINLHWLGHTKQLKRSSPGYCRLIKVLPLLEPTADSMCFGERLRRYVITWAEYRSIVE